MPVQAQDLNALHEALDTHAAAIEPDVIEWRRDIHANPELSNREFRTAALVADHLRSLGMEVRTEVAHTGVVGFLQGGKPGPIVALRADMDALPVTEMVDLPFASKVRTTYNGMEVGVMHACGHDNHVAILMGVASVLSTMKEDLPGSVKFIFQPAEEGAPAGEEGGADLMLREGAFENPRPEVIFGLHVWPNRVGEISYLPGPFMASSDAMRIKVTGRQTHGAVPWGGVDPIVVASQIVLGLQTIASRQLDVTATPSIITIGTFHGGVRSNIIPDEVELSGTIRTFLPEVRRDIERRIRHTVEHIATSAGATAEVEIDYGYPVTVNDPELTMQMLPSLERVSDSVKQTAKITGAEDFSYFANEVPGLFIFLGVAPPDADLATVPRNHSPYFFADEAALLTGVRALASLAVDYMVQQNSE
ncbi:MAG: amidohydrolase [Rhodothermaceae bacterium]|nr:amidohydrolase [Rhodothermaceae bacterium]MYF41075.1 amidohydrolase [Rhodothermaceae bacterium]